MIFLCYPRRPLLIGEGIVRVGFREKEYEALL